MKKLATILTLSFFTTMLFSQTLTQELGGAITDFQFTNNGNNLEVISQVIVPRGQANFSYKYDASYGYGNQIFMLEFISRAPFTEKKDTIYFTNPSYSRTVETNTQLIFYAEDGTVLLQEQQNSFNNFSRLLKRVAGTPENILYVYSISLESYSIALLEKTTRIEFMSEKTLYTRKWEKKVKKSKKKKSKN